MYIRPRVDFCVKWGFNWKVYGTYILGDKKAPCIDREVAVSRRVRLNNNLSENVGHRATGDW